MECRGVTKGQNEKGGEEAEGIRERSQGRKRGNEERKKKGDQTEEKGKGTKFLPSTFYLCDI